MNETLKSNFKNILETEFLAKNLKIEFGSFNFMFILYMKMFGNIPQAISPWENYFYLADDMKESKDDDIFKDYNKNRSIKNFIDNNKDDIFVLRENSLTTPTIFFDDCILFYERTDYKMVMLCPDSNVPERFMKSLVKESDDVKSIMYVINEQGFCTSPMEVKKMDIDLSLQYNDDLPDKEIKELLNNENSGLIILHGEPGTGKTSYIRHLIYSIDKDFLLLDSSVFDYITDSSFIKLMSSWKNSIIILEDCESMLKDRIDGNNKLSALLNLSDGILGDSLNLKFLCTFNANIKKIDKALLRKGRMKLKYEFKKLTKEKTKNLADKLGVEIKENEELNLSEIYNYNSVTTINEVEEKKIGFKF